MSLGKCMYSIFRYQCNQMRINFCGYDCYLLCVNILFTLLQVYQHNVHYPLTFISFSRAATDPCSLASLHHWSTVSCDSAPHLLWATALPIGSASGSNLELLCILPTLLSVSASSASESEMSSASFPPWLARGAAYTSKTKSRQILEDTVATVSFSASTPGPWATLKLLPLLQQHLLQGLCGSH